MESQEPINSLVIENYETIDNILFIDSTCAAFEEYANKTSFPIIYNSSSTKNDIASILEKLYSKYPEIKRIAFISHYAESPMFLDGEPLFTTDDIADEQPENYSKNLQFLMNDIIKSNIKNVDFLACNTLQSANWKRFYEIIKRDNLEIGASNDLTGNIKYGGNWITESNGKVITEIYFNEKIENYAGLLVLKTIDGYTYDYSINANANTIKIDYITGDWSNCEIPLTINSKLITQIDNAFVSQTTNIKTVTYLGNARFGLSCFNNCNALTSVSLPNATTFGNLCFHRCGNLKSVSLPNATSFGNYCFFSCGLTSVSLPNATSFGNSCFNNCTNLTSVSLPNATTFGNNCFNNCPLLTNVSLPNATTFGDYCFYDCKNLTNVSLPYATTFGNNCFNNCPVLTSVSLPNAIKFGDNCFNNCPLLTNVLLTSATTFESNCFSGCRVLTNISLPSATTFGSNCFYNCVKLKYISLPQAIDLSNNCFYGCDNLKDILLPQLTEVSSNCFNTCENLTSVSLPNATSFGSNCFNTCKNLTSVSLPNAIKFGDNCFSNCYNLTSVSLPNATTFETGCFNTCYALKTLLTKKQVTTSSSPLTYCLNASSTNEIQYFPLKSLNYTNGILKFNNILPTDRTDIKILFKFGKILYRFNTYKDKDKDIQGKIDLNNNKYDKYSVYFEYTLAGIAYINEFMTDIPVPDSFVDVL